MLGRLSILVDGIIFSGIALGSASALAIYHGMGTVAPLVRHRLPRSGYRPRGRCCCHRQRLDRRGANPLTVIQHLG